MLEAIEHFFINRYLKKLVKQGYNHNERITNHLELLAWNARKEFREDNKPTIDALLRDCLEDALGNKKAN